MYVVLIVERYKGIRSNLYLSRKKNIIDEIFFKYRRPMSKFLLKQQNTLLLLLLGNSADYFNLLRHFYFCKVLDWFDWTLLLLQGCDLTNLVAVKCSGVVALFCVDYQQQSCQSYPAPPTLSAAAPGLAKGLAVPSMACPSCRELVQAPARGALPLEQWPCSPACGSGFCRSSQAFLPKRN